jgi:multidrug efflux system outer membrane protein
MRILLSFLFATSALAQIGPNYERPNTVTPPTYKFAINWRETRPLDDLPKGTWWRVYGDTKLNDLMARATAHNQTLKATIARFDQARAGTGIARAAFFPSADINSAFTTQRTSPNMPSAFPLHGLHYVGPSYNVPLDFTWELDLWGKIRRQVESARADAAAAANVMQNVLLGMHADVATNYFRIRALDGEMAAVRAAVGGRRQAYDIARARVQAGAGSELEQAQAETEVATAEAEISALQNQRDQLENGLALLTGTNPTAFKFGGNANLLPAPPAIPVGVPTDLLERRPDVAATERRLASATAQIGAIKGNFFPSVKLIGHGGYLSGDAAKLFEVSSLNWNLGPSISVPLFAGGRNRAAAERSRAAHDEALANYRQAVLASFGDVENALAALRNLSTQTEALHRARASAQLAAKIAHARYEAGTSPYLNVIEANRSLLTTERACATLAGQRLIASVSLIKALGGGWDQSLPVTIPVTTPDIAARSIPGGKKGFFTKVTGWFKRD